MAKKGKRKVSPGDVATNRQAAFRFELLDKVEAGMILQGTEVKALRDEGAQMKDSYAAIRDGEVWLHNLHIPPYKPAARANHDPERDRKLLMNRREIEKVSGRINERGWTLVPTRIYFNDAGRAKVEIALARGKDHFDKRESIKNKDMKRDVERQIRDAQR
jgi:SsrA-binding protein